MTDNSISWHNGSTPKSELYDDIYFSTDDGIAESHAVFLDAIGAPSVWQNKDRFTICELGFGTGLNFLNTANLWMENARADQILNYIATEKYPLRPDDIKKAIHWPELEKIRDEFISQYGAEDIRLTDDRINLQLLIGDSLEALKASKLKVDAWYLDGFAPRKNPEMWSNDIFTQMARLSNSGASVATFTAAGFVRRGLEGAGFAMNKQPGFGKKRERLTGHYTG